VDADLRFALELADAADALTLPRFGAADLQVETKPDLTPVTDADRSVERMLRERIGREPVVDVCVRRLSHRTPRGRGSSLGDGSDREKHEH